MGWYSGDHHIHAAGCAHYEKPSEGVYPQDMMRHILGEDLNVGEVLTWGSGWYFQKTFCEGKQIRISTSSNVMRYDVEVSGFPSSPTGHLCLLGLKDQDYPGTKRIEDWPSWGVPILRWAKAQDAGGRIADDGILGLGPAKNRDAPARPVFNPLRAGVVLVLESEQAKVAGWARREAGDFDVVPHHVTAGRKAVRLSFEESFLEIPARAPGQHVADVQVFAQDVAHHVLRIDTLARFLIVSASGGVDVVVSRVPAHPGGINPALELESNLLRPVLDLNLLSPFSIIRSPRALDGIVARGQQDRLPVRPVNFRR